MTRYDWTLRRAGRCLGAFALLVLAALPAAAASDESYGYFRTLDGSATLIQAGSDDEAPVEINQPVLAGDRIRVANNSHVEIVLADRNVLRLDGGTEITLEQLAASPDRNDSASVVRLDEGNLLLTVTSDSYGDQLPRVDTPNAAVYPQDYGTYRITASEGRWTEVTVRGGKAEVVTDRGTKVVRADESAVVEGDRDAAVEIDRAGSYDTLERWAGRLEDDARTAVNDDDGDIDADLRYQAAPLTRYGSWVYADGQRYWRPRVDAGWRPYSHGRWIYTPAGLTWVSYEPWGWVPYHYGSWDYISNWGWLWQPGRTWAPAWVYWYWGPSYSGWCPTGYYTHYYRDRWSSFRFGVYGWAGGGWDGFNRWTFVSSNYFHGYRHGHRDGNRDGHRDGWDVRRYAVPIDQLRRSGPLDRGVITTDTRPLKPETWDNPRHAIQILTDGPRNGRPSGGVRSAGTELPDVTPFIQRKRDLPPTVVRNVVADRPTGRPMDRPTDRPTDNGRPADRGIRSIPADPNDGHRSSRPAERPRVVRPTEGAPRPGARRDDDGRNGSGVVRTVPREINPNPRDRQTDRPRVGRPEPGSPGGSPRPERPERIQPPPSTRDRGGDNGYADRNRDSGRGGASRPEAPRSYNPPPATRDRDSGRGGMSRPEAPRSYNPPPATRERERPRYSPPPASSRPPEASRPPETRRQETREASPPRRGESSRPSSGNQGGGRSEGNRSHGRDRRPPTAE